MPWKTLGLLSVVLPLVVGCAMPAKEEAGFISHREGPQNRPSDRPVPVQGPTKKVTVRVLKDPSYEVWIGVQYTTYNESCRSHSIASLVLGAPAIPQVVTDVQRAPVGESISVFDLYLDRYEPGDCHWMPDGIMYAVFDPQLTASPKALNAAARATAAGKSHVKLRKSCSVVPRNRSPSGRELECYWIGPGFFENSISLAGGVLELAFAPEQ